MPFYGALGYAVRARPTRCLSEAVETQPAFSPRNHLLKPAEHAVLQPKRAIGRNVWADISASD